MVNYNLLQNYDYMYIEELMFRKVIEAFKNLTWNTVGTLFDKVGKRA